MNALSLLFFASTNPNITPLLNIVAEMQKALDLAVGFSTDRFEEAKGFSVEKYSEAVDFLGPVVDDIRLKIIALISGVNLPLIGHEIVVDKTKGDAPTASTSSLATLDTQPKAKKVQKKEDYNEFLKMMEK